MKVGDIVLGDLVLGASVIGSARTIFTGVAASLFMFNVP